MVTDIAVMGAAAELAVGASELPVSAIRRALEVGLNTLIARLLIGVGTLPSLKK